MMRISLILLLFLLLPPSVSQAQSALKLRGSEHPAYSRLVIPVPAGSDWRLIENGQTVSILLPITGATYDASGVFDRLPRTRLLSVSSRSQEEGQIIDLTLSCQCAVEIVSLGQGLLAADIRRRADDAPSPVPVANAIPDIQALEDDAGPAKPVSRQNVDMPAESPGKTATPADARDVTPTELARTSLLKQLTKAADEGFLDLAPDIELDMAETLSPAEPDADDMLPDLPGRNRPTQDIGDRTPLELQIVSKPPLTDDISQIASGLSDQRDRTTPASDVRHAQTCDHDKYLNIAEWPGNTSADRIIGELGKFRQNLVTESGSIEPDRLQDLARYYIKIGFGREAAALIAQHPVLEPDLALLSELARIVEGRTPKGDGPIATATECDGRIRLWRTVGGMAEIDPASPSGQEVLDHLGELPAGLRRLAIHAIAAHAIYDGNPSTARAVIEILDSTPGPVLDTPKYPALLKTLDTVQDTATVRGASIPNPHTLDRTSLLLLANATLTGNSTPHADLSMALSAQERLLTSTDHALAFRLLRARIRSRENAPVEALELVREAKHRWPENAARIEETGRVILTELSLKKLPPVILAAAALGGQDFLEGPNTNNLKQKYASQLYNAGLPNLASKLAGIDEFAPALRASNLPVGTGDIVLASTPGE